MSKERKVPARLVGVSSDSITDVSRTSSPSTADKLTASYVSASGCFTREGFKVGAEGIIVSPGAAMIESKIKLANLRIGRILGKGACGEVRLATDNETDVVFALKIFDLNDESRRKQLLAELKALIGVDCENLLRLHDVFFTGERIHMVMEFMDAGSLEDMIASRPSPSEVQAAAIIRQVANGLHYMHKTMQQVHRDLKPGNILVNMRGEVKISDFGLSKKMESDSQTNAFAQTFVGSLLYLSPERMKGETYSYSGDIWAIGIIAYELVMQAHPYKEHGHTFIELLQSIMETDTPTPDPDPALGFPPSYLDFVKICLNKDARRRPTTGEILEHAWLKKASGRAAVASWVSE